MDSSSCAFVFRGRKWGIGNKFAPFKSPCDVHFAGVLVMYTIFCNSLCWSVDTLDIALVLSCVYALVKQHATDDVMYTTMLSLAV